MQRLRAWWAWAGIGLLSATTLWAFVQQIVLGRPWGNRPGPDWLVWVLLLVVAIGVPLLLGVVTQLRTEVTAQELRVRLVPFHLRAVRIPLDAIASCEARRYRAIREFLGWGIRYGPGGRAYTLQGDHGVQLVLRDGRRILVGSARSAALARAIRRARETGPRA